jgi:hypothetical protein
MAGDDMNNIRPFTVAALVHVNVPEVTTQMRPTSKH